MTRRFNVLVFIGVVWIGAGCGDNGGAGLITRGDLPPIFDVRPASPDGFRRVAGPGARFLPLSSLGNEQDVLRKNRAQAAYAKRWTAREVDIDAIDLGVLFSNEPAARQVAGYYKAQLRAEQRWTITDAAVGEDGYCARYDDTASFAQFSCSWRRKNLVLSATMIADDERDFDATDVHAHAEAIDAAAKKR